MVTNQKFNFHSRDDPTHVTGQEVTSSTGTQKGRLVWGGAGAAYLWPRAFGPEAVRAHGRQSEPERTTGQQRWRWQRRHRTDAPTHDSHLRSSRRWAERYRVALSPLHDTVFRYDNGHRGLVQVIKRARGAREQHRQRVAHHRN